MTKLERTCPRCGLVFASEKLDDLCPSCLLESLLEYEPNDDSAAFWEETEKADAPPARSFSHFELVEEIGRGGMGVVYRARDLSTERIVALKVLQAHHLEVPDLVMRFRAEVRAVTSLDHPHVLPIHEVGECEGIPFFSMKLTTGGSLAHRLGDFLGRPRDAARLLAKISRGVQHAHERGILHRDLKPGNILIDAAGEPYVCDFGLAKWLEDDRKLTLTAAVLGTPHYIAPEQASGEKSLTTAVDIYSLGAILYELLTGRPPFVGQSVIDTLRQASENTPDRPSSLAANVPRDLETICLKCLQREPNARYATAGALAADLDNWLVGRPINARPVNAAEQLWRWAKRNPLPAVLGVSLVCMLGVIAVGASIAAIKIHLKNQLVVAAEQKTLESLYVSDLARARAVRLSGRAGQRFEALDALKEAAQIHRNAEVRNDAAMTLALADLKIERTWQVGTSPRPTRAFDPSLKFFADEIEPGVLRVYDLYRGKELARLDDSNQPAKSRIEYIVWSTGRLVAARYSSSDARLPGMVKIWDIETQKKLCELPAALVSLAPWYAPNIAFSPQANLIAVALPEGGVSIYDAQSSRELARVQTSEVVRCVSFSPDGAYVAFSPAEDKTVYIWNPSSRQSPAKIAFPGSAYSIAWSPDQREIAIGSKDFNIYLYDLNAARLVNTFNGHRQEVTQVIFTHEGDRLISTSRDLTVRVWSLSALTQEVLLDEMGAEPAMRLSQDGTAVAVTSSQAAFLLGIGGSQPICRTLVDGKAPGRASLAASVAFSPDGRRVATACWEGIDVWDVSSGRVLCSAELDPDTEKSVRFGNDASQLLVASRKSGLIEYQIRSERGKTILAQSRVLDDQIDFIFSNTPPGDRNIIALFSGTKGVVRVVDLATGRELFSTANLRYVWDVAISPDQQWMAVSFSLQGGVPEAARTQIWSIREKKYILTLPGGQNGAARFSPDGRWLKITGGGTTNCLWSTSTWTHAEHNDYPGNHHVFDPRGRWVASLAESSEGIVLTDAASGDTLVTLQSPILSSFSWRLASSFDGRRLAAQGADNTLLVWDLDLLRRSLSEYNLAWASEPWKENESNFRRADTGSASK